MRKMKNHKKEGKKRLQKNKPRTQTPQRLGLGVSPREAKAKGVNAGVNVAPLKPF